MKSEKKKSSIPAFIGIASVWIATHTGPGIASGAQVSNYYSRFGKIGLITPFIAMAFLGLCVYFALEFCRVNKVYDFKSFTNKFFYPYEKLFGIFFEVCFLVTALLAPGLCIVTSANLLEQSIGLNMWIGTFFMALLAIVFVIYGASLVKSASTLLTLGIVIILLLIVSVGLKTGAESFLKNWNTQELNISIWMPIWMAISYAGFQSTGIIGNCVSVAEGLKSKKESFKTAMLGMLVNACILSLIVAVSYAFYPESIQNVLPNYYIVQQINMPIFEKIYILFIVIACLSTIITFAYAVIKRFENKKFIKERIKDNKIRSIVISGVLLILDVMVSTFGITKIISVGYTWLGYGSIFAVLIPFMFVGFKKALGNVRENM